MHGGHAGRREVVGVGTCREKCLHDRRVPSSRREVQWGVSPDPGQRSDRRASIQEDLEDLFAVVHRRPVQRGESIGLRGVRVSALSKQRPHPRGVSGLGRVCDRRLCGRRARQEKAQYEDRCQSSACRLFQHVSSPPEGVPPTVFLPRSRTFRCCFRSSRCHRRPSYATSSA